jgi:hypothetical protein
MRQINIGVDCEQDAQPAPQHIQVPIREREGARQGRRDLSQVYAGDLTQVHMRFTTDTRQIYHRYAADLPWQIRYGTCAQVQ